MLYISTCSSSTHPDITKYVHIFPEICRVILHISCNITAIIVTCNITSKHFMKYFKYYRFCGCSDAISSTYPDIYITKCRDVAIAMIPMIPEGLGSCAAGAGS